MQLPTASRHTRVRRLLAVSAAAVAVMIAPTACDYGGYGGGSSSDQNMDDMGNMPGMDHSGSPQEHAIAPVANTSEATPTASSSDRRFSRDGRNDRRGRNHNARPASTTAQTPTSDSAAPTESAPPSDTVPPTESAPPAALGDRGAALPPGGRDVANNGLDILGRDCTTSNLRLHNGFQSVNNDGADVGQGEGVAECVNTEMGEVAAENKLPSLLITKFPTAVGVNQPFSLEISTRNLVRNRFLGAGAGGYYLESSFLDSAGLQRGHFHTACRILDTTAEAPVSGKAPEFFLATEDGKGGAAPDTVVVPIAKGIPRAGQLQCTVWAGDGSHRTPMMTRANETPAIDSVRITVTDAAQPVTYDATGAEAAANDQAGAKQQEAVAQKPDADPALDAASGPGAPPATEGTADAPAPAATETTSAPAGTATAAPADDSTEN